MVDALIIGLIVVGVWILLGAVLVTIGPYDWKYPNPPVIEFLVLPFWALVILIAGFVSLFFEALDYVVWVYYKTTRYTKKYMRRKK